MKIGVDGGGTKTECILVDDAGTIVARQLAPGCNPNVVGTDTARQIATDALRALTLSLHSQPSTLPVVVHRTHLYMSGAPGFWQEFAASLAGFGHVTASPDSLPTLELATDGKPGLVLHAGTGSFVAARAPDGTVHYAGGTGWRFGDPGSGYELGRRAIARALLELQAWLPASRLGPAVRAHTELGDDADVRAVTRYFYAHAEPNRVIAALAPTVLGLATEGDATARAVVIESAAELLDLALHVAGKLFPGTPHADIPTGLSGALLINPVVASALAARTSLRFQPITAAPIEGVRRLVARDR
ncbi:N-acetylglucosamine kinase [Horticoccus sp. 23ND18S-11]|uniref:N-acetylglucosamine kinase n=1 Tax=Horticoccus sp. 23ND18S-11 TaxID=3391832 RepID=UPI0039C9DBBF